MCRYSYERNDFLSNETMQCITIYFYNFLVFIFSILWFIVVAEMKCIHLLMMTQDIHTSSAWQ